MCVTIKMFSEAVVTFATLIEKSPEHQQKRRLEYKNKKETSNNGLLVNEKSLLLSHPLRRDSESVNNFPCNAPLAYPPRV